MQPCCKKNPIQTFTKLSQSHKQSNLQTNTEILNVIKLLKYKINILLAIWPSPMENLSTISRNPIKPAHFCSKMKWSTTQHDTRTRLREEKQCTSCMSFPSEDTNPSEKNHERTPQNGKRESGPFMTKSESD